MSRFLNTIPNNSGFVNLGLVETYPTGGGGPVAYGPTSYFGSDPLPPEQGDNLNNPIDLGEFSSLFKSFNIKNTHGGLTRRQSTLLAFYKIFEDGRREELPINNDGYVFKESAIDYLDDEGVLFAQDYPTLALDPGQYLFLITNDIRYLETNYSIDLNVSNLDWRFVNEVVDEQINFGSISQTAESILNFGSIIS